MAFTENKLCISHDQLQTELESVIKISKQTDPPLCISHTFRMKLLEIYSKIGENLFQNPSIIKEYIYELTSGTIFDFLRIFEEHPEFKIIYEENGNQVDLNKISEMLKAEPIIDNGWIQRFSKELNNESPI